MLNSKISRLEFNFFNVDPPPPKLISYNQLVNREVNQLTYHTGILLGCKQVTEEMLGRWECDRECSRKG